MRRTALRTDHWPAPIIAATLVRRPMPATNTAISTTWLERAITPLPFGPTIRAAAMLVTPIAT